MSTPLQVLKKVKKSQPFRGLKLELFEIICHNPNMTIGEIWNKYANLHPNTDRSRNELAKRVSDLANLGLVKTKGRVLCPVSNRQAYRWTASGKTPKFDVTTDGRKKIIKKATPSRNLALVRDVEQTKVLLDKDYIDSLKAVVASRKKDRTLFSFFFNRAKKNAEIEALNAAIAAFGGQNEGQ